MEAKENTVKTKLVFIRKCKIAVILPKSKRTNPRPLVLSKVVKYSGVILDSKLSWKINVEGMMNKECRGMFGS